MAHDARQGKVPQDEWSRSVLAGGEQHDPPDWPSTVFVICSPIVVTSWREDDLLIIPLRTVRPPLLHARRRNLQCYSYELPQQLACRSKVGSRKAAGGVSPHADAARHWVSRWPDPVVVPRRPELLGRRRPSFPPSAIVARDAPWLTKATPGGD